MSFLGVKPQLLGKCASCVTRQVSLAPVSRVQYINNNIRLASTAAKPRTKAAAPAAPEVASVPKKRISTKTTTVAAPAKSPRKKKADTTVEAPAVETATPVVKKTTTRAASTKTAAKKKADSDTAAEEVKPKAATRTRKTAATTTAKSASTSAAPRFVKATEIPQAKEPAANTTEDGPQTLNEVPGAIANSIIQEAETHAASELERQEGAPETDKPKRTDPSSPEFKQASRRYISVMVALPILLVTSYYLFDRLALGNQPKSLEDYRVPPVEKDGKRATPSV